MTKLKQTKVRKIDDALRRCDKTKDFIGYGEFYDVTYKSNSPKMKAVISFLLRTGEKKEFPESLKLKLSRKVLK